MSAALLYNNPFVPIALAVGVYLLLALGRWKTLTFFVVVSAAAVDWLVWLLVSSNDPAAADGMVVPYGVGLLAGLIAMVRFVILVVTTK